MDSIRVSEAPDTGSIPVEATKKPSDAQKAFLYLFREINFSDPLDNLTYL